MKSIAISQAGIWRGGTLPPAKTLGLRLLLLSFSLLIIYNPAPKASEELAFQKFWQSGETNKTTAIRLGDMDGDGKLDIVAADSATSGETVKVYRNLGNFFTLIWESEIDAPFASLDLGDVDGDGDLDILAGSDQGAFVFVNKGSGQATLLW